MDLNQLYFNHQVLLMEADRASTEGLRQLHEVAASHIAGRIGCMQRSLGAAGACAWDLLAVTPAGSLASPRRLLEGYAS
jgi:hypothetical protein